MTRRLVVFGLSLSSSWGNGHAIPFRGLCREVAARGWQITFFERDVEWYRSNRDVADPGVMAVGQRVTPAGVQSVFSGRVAGGITRRSHE